MITLRIYLRTNRVNRVGESVIYFIAGDEWISSQIKIHWDDYNCIILKTHPKYYIVSPYYQQLKGRAEQCISNHHTSGKAFTKKHFTNFIFDGQEEADNFDFLKLINEYCNSTTLSLGRVIKVTLPL